jgi:hypothetical protein
MTNNRMKLLFMATLFFLALPLMLVGNSAMAADFPYAYDGAIHNGTTGLWEGPAATATCFGNYATDTVGTAPHLLDITTFPSGTKCSTTENHPTWYTTSYPDSSTCSGAGLSWSSSSGCRNKYTDNPAYATQRSQYQCLYCHSGGHATNRAGYLKGGHKNMSRKADGLPWAGSIENGSSIYTGYLWNNPGTTAAGTPYLATTDATTPVPVFWIYDGWIGTAPRAASPGGSYNCGRCHTTGWTADGSMNTTKEPYASFGANIFTDVNLSAYDDNNVSQTYSSWDQFGILCSRCHNAKVGGHANSNTGAGTDDMEFPNPTGTPPITNGDAAASQNVVCYNCHRQVDSHNLPLDEATRNIGTELKIANSHGALAITSHANGYLNSPHAMFSGTYGQLGDSTKYASIFLEHYGSACAACHNLHDSVTDDAVGGTPWNNECGLNCHTQSPTDPYAKQLSQIGHPGGAGTPLANATADDPVSACATCHMPGGIHLFRINPDPSYTTFTTVGQNVPTVLNSEGYPEAFVDLDMACGQCHGGSSTTTTNGAPYISKGCLASYASVMHGGAIAYQSACSSLPPTTTISTPTIDCNFATAGSTVTFTNDAAGGSGGTLQGILVAWGDGVVSTWNPANTSGAMPATFTHTYLTTPLTLNGSTFTVTLTAVDADGGSSTVQCPIGIWTSGTQNSFSGQVTADAGQCGAPDSTKCTAAGVPWSCCTGAGTGCPATSPVGGAYVWLNYTTGTAPNTVTHTMVTGTDASGNYSFDNVPSGTGYTITATKGSYKITCDSVVNSASNCTCTN